MDDPEFDCALSGVVTAGDVYWEGDGLEDLPPGWFELTFRRRIPNPQYLMVQQSKAAQVEIAMTQLPPNAPLHLKEAHRQMLTIQTDALYHSYEENIPPFFTVQETVHIAPVESEAELLEAFNEIRQMLGLDELPPISYDQALEDSDTSTEALALVEDEDEDPDEDPDEDTDNEDDES
jgi:hypothetical protein